MVIFVLLLFLLLVVVDLFGRERSGRGGGRGDEELEVYDEGGRKGWGGDLEGGFELGAEPG